MLAQRVGLVAHNPDIVLPRINKVKFVGLQKDPANQLYIDNVQHDTSLYTYDRTNEVREKEGLSLTFGGSMVGWFTAIFLS